MAVMAGGAVGVRVPSGPATGRSLFTFPLRWIGHISSSLAVLFYGCRGWWWQRGQQPLGGHVLPGLATGLFTFPLCWISHISSSLAVLFLWLARRGWQWWHGGWWFR